MQKDVLALLCYSLCYIILWCVAKAIVGNLPDTERTAALQTTERKNAEAGQENVKSSSSPEGVASVVWMWKIWQRRKAHSLRNMPVWVCSLMTLSCCLSASPFNPTVSNYIDSGQGTQVRKKHLGLINWPVVLMVNWIGQISASRQEVNNQQRLDRSKRTAVQPSVEK